MAKSNGYVIYEGPSAFDGAPIVVIVTGLTNRSSNRKTGGMVQTYILRRDVSPMEAVYSSEADASVCGDCPHRGVMVDGRRKARACYVNLGQGPLSVWRAFERGSYPRADVADVAPLVAGRAVRLGTYGDPGMVPLSVWLALVEHAASWTGYTHQWRWIDSAFSLLLMASADSVEDRRAARGLGYRSFYVVPKGSAKPAGAVLCLSDARGTTCEDCGACAGTRMGAKPNAVDIFITAHGPGAKYV
jgi:hypothetical protein